jgi:hypothetical protein
MNAFSVEERSPEDGDLALPITRGYPLPAPAADRFTRRVRLAVCEPAPTIPNSAVRDRGSPASAGQEDVKCNHSGPVELISVHYTAPHDNILTFLRGYGIIMTGYEVGS